MGKFKRMSGPPCACGCGQKVKWSKAYKRWNKYILGHNRGGKIHSEETKKKMKGKKHTEETKKKISVGNKGHRHTEKTKRKISLINTGRKLSKEARQKISLAQFKCNPNDPYCDAWKDKGYKKDLRKNYCQSVNCKNNYKRLQNHHINLNKKDCRPQNIMTLCASCHTTLHRKLVYSKSANPEDFLIINKLNRITYINKKTKNTIIINLKQKDKQNE